MSFFERFLNGWTEIKIYINRAISYITIVNAGMMLFILLAQFKQLGWEVNLTKYFIPIYVVSILAAILVGYIDTKIGLFKREAERTSDRNPYLVEIRNEIKLAREDLKQIKEKIQ